MYFLSRTHKDDVLIPLFNTLLQSLHSHGFSAVARPLIALTITPALFFFQKMPCTHVSLAVSPFIGRTEVLCPFCELVFLFSSIHKLHRAGGSMWCHVAIELNQTSLFSFCRCFFNYKYMRFSIFLSFLSDRPRKLTSSRS